MTLCMLNGSNNNHCGNVSLYDLGTLFLLIHLARIDVRVPHGACGIISSKHNIWLRLPQCPE